jgi:hypothetical protein
MAINMADVLDMEQLREFKECAPIITDCRVCGKHFDCAKQLEVHFGFRHFKNGWPHICVYPGCNGMLASERTYKVHYNAHTLASKAVLANLENSDDA